MNYNSLSIFMDNEYSLVRYVKNIVYFSAVLFDVSHVFSWLVVLLGFMAYQPL